MSTALRWRPRAILCATSVVVVIFVVFTSLESRDSLSGVVPQVEDREKRNGDNQRWRASELEHALAGPCDVAVQNTHGMVRVAKLMHARGLKIAVYAHGDVVSTSVIKSGMFEPRLVRFVLKGFNHMKAQAGEEDDFLLVDIGVNIGVFALAAAGNGIPVVGVDAARSNLALVKHSLRCLNRDYEKGVMGLGRTRRGRTGLNVSLIHSALCSHAQERQLLEARGTRGGKPFCSLMSGQKNIGDGILVCNESQTRDMERSGYHALDRSPIATLDGLMQERRQRFPRWTIMKIDVEGYEWHILGGATRTLMRGNAFDTPDEAGNYLPRLIIAEVWPTAFNISVAWEYAEFMMVQKGYHCAAERITARSRTGGGLTWCSSSRKDFNGTTTANGRRLCIMTRPSHFAEWFTQVLVPAGILSNVFWVEPAMQVQLTPWIIH